MRACEPTYDKSKFESQGVQVEVPTQDLRKSGVGMIILLQDMPFRDGDPPPVDVQKANSLCKYIQRNRVLGLSLYLNVGMDQAS